MSLMEYNANPISLREGSIFIDGIEAYDGISCTITVTPDVWSGRQLGETTPSRRWLGAEIKVVVKRRRATKWHDDVLQKYLNGSDKSTPEIKIQGLSDDENSDYYDENGSQTVTAVGCVPTGDISVLALDAAGDVREDEITYYAKNLV